VGPAGGAWVAEAASLALMAKPEVCSHFLFSFCLLSLTCFCCFIH